ncbi:MAG TPA: substrate-binding domain-containing protein [Acidimicrobiales bacterium]|nr:substrate-binding domain-containing protein [Acidimicrobiales bacterium]
MAARWTIRPVALVALVMLISVPMALASAGPSAVAAAPLTPVVGQGSTEAALAFSQWIADASSTGLHVSYTATSSVAGLQAYANNTADFAGSEAEFSSLGSTAVPRGYAYAPDLAEATAIIYNVDDSAGRIVSTLHLSRLTVAKIFMGLITNWDDAAISADNNGLVLPNHPITVVGRSGQSGTTALFYDFVKQTDPTDFAQWAAANGFDTSSRLLEIDQGAETSGWQFYSGSDQQAEAVSSAGGLWSIGYDEFGYAKIYKANVAWIQNQSGNWVQPYSGNITAALQSAVLAPDTSEDLDGVYTSSNPVAYPISDYSYFVYQCAPSADRPTCGTPYADPGMINTLAQFMRYVACAGQAKMSSIGYGVLPPQLSQLMADAIGSMSGQPAEQLTAQNCANPAFQSPAPLSAPVVAPASVPNGSGYLLADASGDVSAHGVLNSGSMAGQPLNAPISQIASTSDGAGYWLVASDGGVFTFGDAQFSGSMGNQHLNAPVVGMAATPDGGGYWLVASDGGVFTFGDAQFSGSMGGSPPSAPVVGIAAAPRSGGYWLVTSNGDVSAYDAPDFGSH